MSSKPKRTILIVMACASFLVGLWLGHNWWQVGLDLVAFCVATAILSRRSRCLPAAIVLLGVTLGIWRGYQSNFTYQGIAVLLSQRVTLVGRVVDDPVVTEQGRVKFTLGNIAHNNQKLPGSVRVTSHYAKLDRGNQVRVTGRLYPTVGSRQAQFGFAGVEVLGDNASGLEQLRRRFFAGMRSALPEPMASLALGLLVGTRGLLPAGLQTQLTAVGLSHLVAVSGYNLTIMQAAIYRPLVGHSRRLATIITFWLIGSFCLVTGFSASIVRAAIVAVISLVCSYYGRTVKPMVVLGLAAVVTTAVKPEYLWADAGWQLSFLAFFGILVLAPLVEQRLRQPNPLKSLVIQSLSAQLLTLPLVLVLFQRLPLAGLLSNVLVLPLIPVTMLTSFVAGLTGMLAPAVAGWLAWPAAWFLYFILAIVNWLAATDQELKLSLSGLQMWGIYGWVAVICWLMAIRRRPVALAPATPIVPERVL